mgnify:CR=1 FL=1
MAWRLHTPVNRWQARWAEITYDHYTVDVAENQILLAAAPAGADDAGLSSEGAAPDPTATSQA